MDDPLWTKVQNLDLGLDFLRVQNALLLVTIYRFVHPNRIVRNYKCISFTSRRMGILTMGTLRVHFIDRNSLEPGHESLALKIILAYPSLKGNHGTWTFLKDFEM